VSEDPYARDQRPRSRRKSIPLAQIMLLVAVAFAMGFCAGTVTTSSLSSVAAARPAN
jgi:hypothetical protein